MFDSRIKPKKLNWFTLLINLPLISKFGYFTDLLRVWKTINLVFDTFNANLFAPNHPYILKKFTVDDILSDIVIYIAK